MGILQYFRIKMESPVVFQAKTRDKIVSTLLGHQSVNAALTFTFLPRKEDPGFSAVSDKSVLSYFTVLENRGVIQFI